MEDIYKKENLIGISKLMVSNKNINTCTKMSLLHLKRFYKNGSNTINEISFANTDLYILLLIDYLYLLFTF